MKLKTKMYSVVADENLRDPSANKKKCHHSHSNSTLKKIPQSRN
jgi:hypothetical protein